MSGRERAGGLPPRIQAAIQEVLESSGLDIAEGRDDVARELTAHFEDGLSAGTSEDELLARFGDPVAAGARIARARRRSARGRGAPGRWWASPSEWQGEVVGAVRRLRRSPGFVSVVVLTLGLGVGANTAVFSVLNAVLLEELPYAQPERLVRVYESGWEAPTEPQFLRAPVASEYRRWDEVFESFATLYTYRELGADITDGDVPRRVTVVRVSAGYFETLGVAPERGRTFREEESFGPGEGTRTDNLLAQVTVIGHRLWLEQYAADPGIVGRMIHLDDVPFEVVGVMPPGFSDPFGPQGDAWIPQDLRTGGSNSFGNSYLSAVARLRDGVSLQAARERAGTLVQGFVEAQPEVGPKVPLIEPLRTDIVGPTRRAMLWILAGAAVLVLLTACVNVANLLFGRGLSQDRHLALKAALGSGRPRLLAGILLENGLLAGLGGLAGLGVGWLGVRGLDVLAPEALPTVIDVEMGGRVFLFALAVTAGALLVFGLTPALRLSRAAPAEVLRSGDRASTVGRVARRIRDGLVIVQVAAALVLVAGAALLARSFDALTDVPLGVDAEGVLTFEVHLPVGRYPDGPARHALHAQLHERVRDLPGVLSVGATSWLPVNGRYHSWSVNWHPDDPGAVTEGGWHNSDVRIIAGDYFDAMGIELLRGASPEDTDYEAGPVAWVSRTFADQILAGVDPLETSLWLNGPRRVVGVVDDVAYDTWGEEYQHLYLPHAQYHSDRNWALTQTVRARGDLADLGDAIGRELRALDGQLVLHRPRTFEDVLSTARAQDRFATFLMAVFAGLALVLSIVGTYGVLAGSVAGRTREIGIRMALGADAARVRLMVLRYATALIVPGILLGLVGAWIGSRWIEELLFQVGGADPLAYAGAIATFVVVGIFSGWLPAERATRVDTIESLAAE